MEIIIGLLEFNSSEHLESIALRDQILRKPLGLKFKEEDLQSESSEFHIGAMQNEDVIGILLLRQLDQQRIKMRQVAVLKSEQRKSIGRKMVHFSEDFALGLGHEIMELHARIEAIPFYEKLNYKCIGDQFFEVGIPHYKMEKQLKPIA